MPLRLLGCGSLGIASEAMGYLPMGDQPHTCIPRWSAAGTVTAVDTPFQKEGAQGDWSHRVQLKLLAVVRKFPHESKGGGCLVSPTVSPLPHSEVRRSWSLPLGGRRAITWQRGSEIGRLPWVIVGHRSSTSEPRRVGPADRPPGHLG